MASIAFRITGTSPLLMQAETLANPLHPLTRAHKAVSTKRKKSEDDYLWLMESEWSASMYYDEEIGPFIPALNIESCIAEAGKIHRLGKTIKQAVQVVTDRAKLEYEGPRQKEKLWKSERFADVRTVTVNQKRNLRCRPIFLRWSAMFDVEYMEDVLDRGDLVRVVEEAGRRIGVGTYRPRFGRFEVEVLS
ncbi:hypothetical protein AB8810_12705 [Xanthomonas sp. NCPPB 3005]|uniref:hypothetical protein n=1 Tax=Xanthomonas sp. NCPPB 3005 TaxID=3240913 RepID=UPI0035122D92